MWTSIEPHIAFVQQTHDDMRKANDHKTSYQQLVKFKDTFLNNTRHMAAFGKYFSFGTQSVSNST